MVKLEHTDKEAYERGFTIARIARTRSLTPYTAYRDLKDLGTTFRPRGNQPLEKPSKHVMEDYVLNQQLHDPEIAARYHVHKSTVRRWRESYNLPPVRFTTDLTEQSLRKCVERRMSDPEIACTFGISASKVLKLRGEYHIPPSSPPTQLLKKKPTG